MIEFIFGASAFGCCVIALAFLSAWRRTGDRLFALFSLAFWAFAANRVAIRLSTTPAKRSPTSIWSGWWRSDPSSRP